MVIKLLAALLAFMAIGSEAARAHQPVKLLNSDTTAAKGPLLVDGTVSFAIRAAFTKSGQTKAFRAQFKSGDQLSVQYLIVDKKPENTLRTSSLPSLVITPPTGSAVTIKFDERTKFFEPYGRVNYLYLARYTDVAQAGIYNFTIKSKSKAAVTVAVGDKEIFGDVLRGPAPTSATTPAASATPTPVATTAGYTMAQVSANNSAKSCWAVIEGSVYNLTAWINSHPGGMSAILSLCGTEATSSFKAQHANQSRPTSRLSGYLLGPLAKN
jgi:cytochrome b involved in lipid metabolism